MTTFFFKIKELQLKPSNTQEWLDYLEKNDDKNVSAVFERETGVRSSPQNNALHLGFQMIAKALNEAGLDMRKVLKPEIDIPWTTESIKKYLWKPVQKVMTGKESTKDLTKTGGEINEIWNVIMRHLGEKHEIEYIPFPSKEQIKESGVAYQQRDESSTPIF